MHKTQYYKSKTVSTNVKRSKDQFYFPFSKIREREKERNASKIYIFLLPISPLNILMEIFRKEGRVRVKFQSNIEPCRFILQRGRDVVATPSSFPFKRSRNAKRSLKASLAQRNSISEFFFPFFPSFSPLPSSKLRIRDKGTSLRGLKNLGWYFSKWMIDICVSEYSEGWFFLIDYPIPGQEGWKGRVV